MTKETLKNIVREERNCRKCDKSFVTYLGASAYSVICPNCGCLHTAYNGVLEKSMSTVKRPAKPGILPFGKTAVIKDIPYICIAHSSKQETGTVYFWNEYSLFNPIHGTAFLSEYNGHWTYLTEMSTVPSIEGTSVIHDGNTYDLFAKYKSRIAGATGEFLYQFSSDESVFAEEFIIPGYLLAKETTKENITWYKGEYIQPSEIKSAFDLSSIPDREGVGMIQPFISKFTEDTLRKVCMFIAITWGILQLIFLGLAHEEVAFTQSFNITDSLNKKEVYTKSFDLKHGTANVEIQLSTNVDNNWMYTGVTLVNENTGDLYDAELEASYYRGYTDGENWSEGKPWISKVISEVPEGKYYMVLYPVKPDSMRSTYITVSATRDVYIFSNGLIVLLLVALFPGYYFYRIRNFEKQRWYNSNYSPYEEEE